MKMELKLVVSLLATMTAFLSCLSDEIVIVQTMQLLRSLGSLIILVVLIVMMK